MKRTLLLVCLLAVGGCSSTSFVGKRFDNFTAYYNTFYNAKKAYADAVKAMEQPDKAIDRTTYLLVFDPGNRGSGTRDFENAIKKSADVLRGHPDSKWVDDALLLIGKSYYHMGNTVGAEQKFREVIDRASGLEDESRFWLGLSLISGGALDEAVSHLQASIDREKVSRKWQARMRLALGEVYVRQERWSDAAEQLAAGTKRADDDELAGRAQFLLGQVLETAGDYDGAAEAYRDVDRHKPRYELAYAAKFSSIRVAGEHGNPDEALDELRKMARDDKNFAYRGDLDYLRGRILKADFRSQDALNVFYGVLYDSDSNVSSIRGALHYHLGLLFRDQFVDFDQAAAHFDTAATSLARGRRPNASGREETLAPAPYAITDADDLAEVFGNYAEFHSEVQHYDSLLALGSLEGEAFVTRIEEIRRQLAEQIVEERRDQARRAAEAGFRAGGATELGRSPTQGRGGGEDYETAGFLYHRDRSRVQDGLLAFFDRWGERPLVENWRRSAAIASGTRTASEEGEEAPGEQPQIATPISGDVTTEALLSSVEIDISDIPRTPERQAEMKQLRSAARYELANVLFLSIGLPDSAAVWYRRVLDEAQDAEIRARALYALAEVQQSLGDEESAAAIYQQVLDTYPDSEVASRSAQRLGVARSITTVTTADLLSRRYQEAFDLWVNGSFETGMREMLVLAASYPDTAAAGRALLAAGAIYADWAEIEGRDLLEPIGIEVEDSVWIQLGLLDPPADPETQAVADSAAAPDRIADDVSGETLLPDSASVVAPDSTALRAAELDSVAIAIPSPDSAAVSRAGIDVVVEDDPAEDEDRIRTGTIDTVRVPTQSPADSASSAVTARPTTGNVAGSVADRLSDEGITTDSPVGAEEAGSSIYVVDLYSLVASRYPGSEYAQRAAGLIGVLEERQKALEADDSTAVADSLGIVEPVATADSLIAKERLAAPDSVSADDVSLEVDDEIRAREAVREFNVDSTRASRGRPVKPDSVDEGPRLRAEDRLLPGARPPLPAAPDTVVYEEAETVPILVGGAGALQRMFRYPDTAAEGGVTGRVGLSFEIDQRGRVVDPVVVDSVGAGCDEEAERVVALSRYRPATIGGRPVRFRMSIEGECAPAANP